MDDELVEKPRSRLPVGWVLLLWCALLFSMTLTGYQALQTGMVPPLKHPTRTATQTLTPSPTPTPLRRTAEYQAKPLGLRLTYTPTPSPTASPSPTAETRPYRLGSVDLSDFHTETHLEIEPAGAVYPAGAEIHLTFYPGDGCQFGDQRACVQSLQNGELTFLTIHSGNGGEGEAFRRSVEGSGLNTSAYSLEQIAEMLAGLEQSPAILSQADGSAHLVLAAAVRIPADQVAAYFALPVSDALQLAADQSGAFREALSGPGARLVFETCGWKHPAEGWYPGLSAVTGSVYVVIFREF